MTIKIYGPLLLAAFMLTACDSKQQAQAPDTQAAQVEESAQGGELWDAVPAGAEGFDRAAVAQKIAERLKARDEHSAKGYALWKRSIKGEDVSAEQQALGKPPETEDLREEALRVVKIDPTDEAAAQAIRLVLMSYYPDYDMEKMVPKWDSPPGKLHAYLGQLIQQHHANRPDVSRLAERLMVNDESKLQLWQKIYASNTDVDARGNAAAELMDYYFGELNKPDLSEQQRTELREKGLGYAKEIKEKYAGVIAGSTLQLPRYMEKGKSTLGEFVANREAVLQHSVGETLPSIKVATLKGTKDELKNYQGKVLIVDFWATWCGPCRKGHPDLVAIKKEMAGKPFEIVGISVDNKPSDITQYMKDTLDLPWVHWYIGPNGPLLKEWGVQGFPTYLMVDAKGVVRERTTHFSEESKALVRKMVAEAQT